MTHVMRFRLVTSAAALGAALLAAPAIAQPAAAPATIQAALASDVGTLSDKFVGLAKAMAGKYDWKPGQGVRSVADVFNLIVGENKMLTAVLTGAQGGGRGNAISDPAELQEALRASYAALKTAVAGLSDADLKTPVKLFGRDMTKQGAALLLIMDQHEHLGQSIAYARSNNVVPPWSK